MATATRPFVSVIIPVYNDEVRLRRCLQALDAQSWPRERYEVIVIDNGSEQPLTKLVEPFHQVRLLEERQPGSYAARNRGLEESRGEVIAFTDADCVPTPTWIEQGVTALHRERDTGLVGGRVEMMIADPKKPTAVELYERALAFQQVTNIRRNRYSVTANAFTSRHVFDRVGTFNARLKSGGDVEWGRRVDAAGYKLVYADDTVVAHPARRQWSEVYTQALRMAGGLHDRRREKPRSTYRWLQNAVLLFLTIPTTSLRILRGRELSRLDDRLKAAVVMAGVHMVLIWEQLRLQIGISTPHR
jgi:glycosyltransferase involved in cell wall biosynthesis